MRNKFRWVAVVMCLVVFGSMAVGSGSSSSSDTKDIVKEDESASSYKDSGSETAAETKEEAKEETKNASTEITIEEQVLVDQDGIKITATGYETDSIWGEGITMLIENETGNDVTIGCTALIVNDFMITDLFSSTVAAGKKANETMHLSNSGLKAAGIGQVGKIEIYFHIYDSDSWEKIFDTDCVTIKTSGYDNMDTTPDDTGTELYNDNGIRIVGKTVDENSFWGTAILLYIENNSGKNVGVNVDDMSINGFMMTPYFSSTVYDGKKAVDDITIMSSDLEANNISAIEEVELKFHIFNAETYDTVADSEPIVFSAK